MRVARDHTCAKRVTSTQFTEKDDWMVGEIFGYFYSASRSTKYLIFFINTENFLKHTASLPTQF